MWSARNLRNVIAVATSVLLSACVDDTDKFARIKAQCEALVGKSTTDAESSLVPNYRSPPLCLATLAPLPEREDDVCPPSNEEPLCSQYWYWITTDLGLCGNQVQQVARTQQGCCAVCEVRNPQQTPVICASRFLLAQPCPPELR